MLFSVFILPFLFIILVTATFISGVARDLPIAVLDKDSSSLSRSFIRSINATPAVMVKYQVTTVNEGEDLLKSAKAYALIIIPKNFQKDIYLQKQPKLLYYYNNQMIAVGGLITRDIKTAVQTLIIGLTANTYAKKGKPLKITVDKTSLIRIDERIRSNPYFNYSYFLMYSLIAHIFQVLITLTAILAVGSEFKYGTTKNWLKTANNCIITAVFGKLLPYFLLFYIFIAGTYGAYIRFYDAPFTGSISFTSIGIVLFILSYQLMGTLFVAILHNCRKAMSLGGVYTSLGFSLAGMTFPSFAMPTFVRVYSAMLPVRPFVALIVDQALKGVPFIYDISYIYWLFAFIVVGLCALPLLKKHLGDETLCFGT
jgi:ABC-2 type transport system permease protein